MTGNNELVVVPTYNGHGRVGVRDDSVRALTGRRLTLACWAPMAAPMAAAGLEPGLASHERLRLRGREGKPQRLGSGCAC